MGRHSAPDAPTQVKFPWRAAARTVFQLGIGAAAAMPQLVESSGLPDTAWGIGTALGVSAAVTRVMAIPGVDALIRRRVPWLSATGPGE
ncbi:hypothetical protein [Nocardia cyriacigeorgica]|uniref:hypothetical protein n=1 Tax=Nocardia cyriacigeorgica TaxID=135487 RepID=UPI0024559873|nr:hypothetical protein [Nocardia cyriacigeorgica]